MAANRLIHTPRPGLTHGAPSLATVKVRFTCTTVGCSSEKGQFLGEVGKKPVAVTKAAASSVAALGGAVAVQTVQTKTSHGVVGLDTLLVFIRTMIIRKLNTATNARPWSLIVELFVEKVIMDCRFFTMFAVAGTLLGSVLCFLEGVFLVIESYIQYFHAVSHHSDYGHFMQLLIEALDMFLVGTAMLTFGMGLHVMFVGSRGSKGKGSLLPSSNFFGLFYLKDFPSWARMKSISKAKSKIGHALMLLLQVGVLEKFKNIPLVSSLDLACFAGAVFVSSVGLFMLSRLSISTGSKNV